jgi:uncharacterized protein YraI
MKRFLIVLAALMIGATAHAQMNIWAMNQQIQNQYNQAYAYQRPYYYAPPVYYQPEPYYGYRSSEIWYSDFRTRNALQRIERELRWQGMRDGR